MTPLGIETTTFRFVVKCLNQLHHRVPRVWSDGFMLSNRLFSPKFLQVILYYFFWIACGYLIQHLVQLCQFRPFQCHFRTPITLHTIDDFNCSFCFFISFMVHDLMFYATLSAPTILKPPNCFILLRCQHVFSCHQCLGFSSWHL